MIKRFIMILLLCFAFLSGNGDVLLWTIDSTSFVDDTPMSVFVSPLQDNDDNWAVGRVKATTGAGIVKYLDLYAPDGDINVVGETYPGAEGIWIGGGGEFYGAEWNQGILPQDIDASTLFAIEIGMNHWIDDGTEQRQINFELLAFTDPYTYESLQKFIYPSHDLNPLTAVPWNPTYYHTVPEPNSFLLFTLGLAMLLLKKKKF